MRADATLPRSTAQEGLSAHARELIVIAAPIALSLLAQKALNVTDAVMLGGQGPREFAAGLLATSVFFTIVTPMHGVMSGLTVLLSHARGAGDDARVPTLYGSALLLATLLSIPVFLVMSTLGTLLNLAGIDPQLASDTGRSAAVLRWGVPGAMLGLTLMRAFLPAVGGTRVLLSVALIVVLVNAVLNRIFIHGFWLVPAMGYVGSAAATASVLTISATCLLWVAHRGSRYRIFTQGFRVDMGVMRQILGIGAPVSVTRAVEVAVFLVAGLSLGSLDSKALPAHQIAFNVVDTIFAVPLALSSAACVRLAYWSGAGRPAQVNTAGAVALAMGAVFMLGASAVLWLLPQSIVGFYLDVSLPANREVVTISVGLLGIATLFLLGDGIQTVAAGCLRALRDTKLPMVLSTACYWGIAFPLGQWLARHRQLGATGIWIGLTVGVSTAALLLTCRFFALSRRASRQPPAAFSAALGHLKRRILSRQEPPP